MSTAGYESYRLGDRVYCLAWIGQPFDVVAKDDERGVIGIETPPEWPTFAQVDVFPETMFLLSREHWDQIWYWLDRAGVRYLEVFERFVARHRVGEVIPGYHLPDGLLVTLGGMGLNREAKRTMMFRIQALDVGRGQIRVHPVAALGTGGTLLFLAGGRRSRRCVAQIGTDGAAPPRDAPVSLVSHLRRDRPQLGGSDSRDRCLQKVRDGG